MNGIPTLHLLAASLTALYGIVSIGGGLIGYLRGSPISLIAGGPSGVLLLACAFGILRLPLWSMLAAVLVALLLVGNFTASLLTKGDQLSEFRYLTALIMINGGVLVIVNALLALLTGSRTTTNP